MTFEPWESLLEAARAGADWAWADLYRAHAPKVRGYAVSQGVADPDDIVGETFLQAVRNLDRFAGTEPEFRAWLFTIVHRRILDARRRASRKPEQLSGAVPDRSRAEAAEDVVIDAGLTPQLRRALAALTPEQRQVIALRVVADFSVDHVARILGKRAGAVKALQHRALERLRTVLAGSVSK